MKYMGSKNRISKYIIPIMKEFREEGQFWVEPFVGGGNSIDKVEGNRIGGDINKWAINGLISIRDYLEFLPKNNLEFTEEDYKQLYEKDSYPFKGYAGFVFSYGGKWMGGWARDKNKQRDYVAEAYRNAKKQSPKLKDVKLLTVNYNNLPIPKNSIIYCDPPYKNTTKYQESINYKHFYSWCLEKAKEGHTIFLSEYEAPNMFECIWEKEVNSSLTQDTGSKKNREKLFRLII